MIPFVQAPLFAEMPERVTMSRVWCMPSSDTYSMPPVANLLDRWLMGRAVIVDPFARNARRGTLRNDLNPDTLAEYHMEAGDFCRRMLADGVVADAVLFDPPYSPRQISECYQSAGLTPTQHDTQGARLYADVRTGLARLLADDGIAISMGWNSSGLGSTRGMRMEEVLLCCHGGAHNDTIVVVERVRQ